MYINILYVYKYSLDPQLFITHRILYVDKYSTIKNNKILFIYNI